MMDKKLYGHLCCLGAYLIFGLNIIACKGIANSGLITPMGVFTFRALGATLFFWIIGTFLPRQRVPLKDIGLIFLASMTGLYLTQLFFLEGIKHITPMDCSMLTTLSPIFTMCIAAIALKEPITLKKAGGVAISFAGVIFLILNTVQSESAGRMTEPIGIILILLNGLGWASYLGIFRKLISRYDVFTFMKWMFLFSLAASIPFGGKELISIDYSAMPGRVGLELGFVILFSTCIAYLLIPIGQKVLRPTIVSLYSYVQPLMASIISICIGMDSLSWQKILAAAAMISGAVLVNRSRAAQ